jgi:PAS domain S-box-containing protein
MMESVLEPESLRWDLLFEASPIPFSVIDPHGRQWLANRAYATFLGYPWGEVDQIDVGRITRPEDRDWTRNYLLRLISGEIDHYASDKVYVRKDGSEVLGHLSTVAVRDDDGTVSMLIGTITPVETRYSPSDLRMRRMVEFTSDSLLILDREGNVVETSGRMTATLGYPLAYWNVRNARDLVAQDDWAHIVEIWRRLLADPVQAIDTELVVVAADGTPQTLQLRFHNCLDDPVLDGIVVVARNITAHRETVAELSRQRETAEAVADAQTRLLATVSHELRNPLHAVRGLAELLASEELPVRAQELASSLARQLSGLARVTQDLLDSARLDAGQIAIEAVPTDLAALIDDVVELGRAAAGDRPIELTRRLASGVPGWVIADTARLRQVLGNLVGNAVKFTERGSVQLVVRPEADDRLLFSVIDTGVGIPLDEQAAVLEPFRVASTAGDRRGAGLGLSIVQRLVTAMNGQISLSSVVGEGTRFEVRLPLRTSAAPATAVPAGLPAGLVVLVVEDNPVNQHLARSQLERLGATPIVVGSGEDGVAFLADPSSPHVDAVLMDHQLPGVSGIEATQQIRQLPGAVAATPVVGLSASASNADRDAFISAGMNDFVAKPASLGDLRNAIGAAVSADRRQPQALPATAASPTGNPAPDVVAGTAIDVAVLETLAADLGSSEIVADLIDTFLDELPGRMLAITSAVGDDPTAAKRAAHTLKSSARLLGAAGLADACAEIEREGASTREMELLASDVEAAMRAWRSR